ncbi:hypothetical protein CAEBREN_17180 [Caenorhabditis brenneri]|uniref:Uncharacterized protein n=1 Tax=Caenorhabditis brenneri TaxID=135651 RepID=G0PK82_CAEBE|nr:hypothetical protein CAEBREN_17180 [Caenorhabditis brenneri]
MFRPPRPPRHQEECSCENHEEVPCDEDGETTTPVKQETTSTKPTTTTAPSTTAAPTSTSTTTSTTVTTTKTTTTTTPAPTTSRYPCQGALGGSTPFKRQKGWWCTKVSFKLHNALLETIQLFIGQT